MPNTAFQAQPSQYNQPFSTRDGTQYTIGPTGLISIPSNFAQDGFAAGFSAVPSTTAKTVTNPTAGSQTANQYDLTGATDVTAIYTNVNGGTLTTRTAAQMYTDAGSPAIGSAYNLRIVVPTVDTLGLYIAPGTGVTWVGKQFIPGGGQLDLVVTWTSATTCTISYASVP
jgi:hypothetical protein